MNGIQPKARSEIVIRSIGQAVEVNDVVIQVRAVHRNRVELIISGPEDMHLAAEMNLEWLMRNYRITENAKGWRFAVPLEINPRPAPEV